MIRLENAACSNSTTFSHVQQVSPLDADWGRHLIRTSWKCMEPRKTSKFAEKSMVKLPVMFSSIYIIIEYHWTKPLERFFIIFQLSPKQMLGFERVSRHEWINLQVLCDILHMSSVFFGWWSGMSNKPLRKKRCFFASKQHLLWRVVRKETPQFRHLA